MNIIEQKPKNSSWETFSYLTCSVLPVRMACNLNCKFCFSKSSISLLEQQKIDWSTLDLENYYQYCVEHGAIRLVITGGGEPLLDIDGTLNCLKRSSEFFSERTLFTNGLLLDNPTVKKLREHDLSYLCWSRHHFDDDCNRMIMGKKAESSQAFLKRAEGLSIRATCVMAKGFIDNSEKVWDYIDFFYKKGIRQFTFKHTYSSYENSYFGRSTQNDWVKKHQINKSPFRDEGKLISRLPWGPEIRKIGDILCCYYYEPTPMWERETQIGRSLNLLADGKVYGSLEDQQSLLYQLRN